MARPLLSYLIASIKPDALEVTLNSIRALPPHPYEIVVCSPTPPISTDVIYLKDYNQDGSTYAFNKGVQACSGDWVVVGIDDHVVNYDVNKFLETAFGLEMHQREYQVVNLGAPWNDTIDRNIRSHGLNIDVPGELRGHSYPVITFPAVSMKTVYDKFNGHLFHPDLLHHFVDHWIGLFCSVKQPNYNFNQLGHGPYWTQHVAGEHTVRKYDDHDSEMFCRLAAAYIRDPSRGYTQPL